MALVQSTRTRLRTFVLADELVLEERAVGSNATALLFRIVHLEERLVALRQNLLLQHLAFLVLKSDATMHIYSHVSLDTSISFVVLRLLRRTGKYSVILWLIFPSSMLRLKSVKFMQFAGTSRINYWRLIGYKLTARLQTSVPSDVHAFDQRWFEAFRMGETLKGKKQ